MRPLRALTLLVIATLGAALAAPPAGAAPEPRTVAFSVQMHGDPAAQQFRTTGADGQIRYGNGHLEGVATVDGETVAVELLAEVRYTDGAGPFTGFWTLTYPSGDSLALTYRGTTKVADGVTTIRGRLGVLGGSGALANVRGTGTVSGQRTDALGGDVTYELVLRLRGLP